MNHKLLEVQQSARQKEITTWLAPAVYDVHYYQNDLANARALRHPKTCQWIFKKEEMGLLFGDDRDSPGNGMHEKSFLWIHAKPVRKMQSHCPSQLQVMHNVMDLAYRSRPPRKQPIQLEILISPIQPNANSKICTGGREDYPIIMLD